MTGLMWLILAAIIGVCYVLRSKFGWCDFVSFILAIILVVLVVVCVPLWYADKQFKAEYEITQETIEAIRESDHGGLERAALIHKIIDINRDLAIKKYWNGGWWDWYTPDDVANLEPLH